jgi:hypothetical protein
MAGSNGREKPIEIKEGDFGRMLSDPEYLEAVVISQRESERSQVQWQHHLRKRLAGRPVRFIFNLIRGIDYIEVRWHETVHYAGPQKMPPPDSTRR